MTTTAADLLAEARTMITDLTNGWSERELHRPPVELIAAIDECLTRHNGAAEADAIWATLSPQAKNGWVAAMMPAPAPLVVPLISPEDQARLLTEYVSVVRGNTVPDYDATGAVLAAIADPADRWDIVMELSDTAGRLAIDGPDYDGDPDGVDAFNDLLETLLPAVAEALDPEGVRPTACEGWPR